MALINCPECGKEISDKAPACIHCGFPLESEKKEVNKKCTICGTTYDFSEEYEIAILPKTDEYVAAIGKIRRKTSLSLVDGKKLVEIIRETKSVPETFTPSRELEKEECNKQDEKRKREERIKSVPMPDKPRIPKLWPIIGLLLCWLAITMLDADEWERQSSMNNGDGDPVFYGIFYFLSGIALIAYGIYRYTKEYRRYKMAQINFEVYQRMVIREQDEAKARQEVQAEIAKIRRINVLRCPICQSTNVTSISTASRAISIATVGLASGKIGKQYKCQNCKHMW